MLLAIDVGNTNTVFGVLGEDGWLGVWRRATDANETEDQLAAWLGSLLALKGLPLEFEGVVCASVVPQMNAALSHLARKWLQVEITLKPLRRFLLFITSSTKCSLFASNVA